MAVKSILKMGNPRLYEVSASVNSEQLSKLDETIQDMIDTMDAADGAGLAAPQIGIMKRIVIFGVENNPRYPHAHSVPFTILINPEIEYLSDEIDYGWEGCLSVPGLRGLVPRNTQIRYRGLNQKGEAIDRTVTGFHARVVQHECDHLDGILFPMRVEDMKSLGFEDQLKHLWLDCPPTQPDD